MLEEALGVAGNGSAAASAAVLFAGDALGRLLSNVCAPGAPDARGCRQYSRRSVLVACATRAREAVLVPAADPRAGWLPLADNHKLVLLDPPGEPPAGATYDVVALLLSAETACSHEGGARSLAAWATQRARAGGVVAGLTLDGGVAERRYDAAARRGERRWTIDQPVRESSEARPSRRRARGGARVREPVLSIDFGDADWPPSVWGRVARASWGAAGAAPVVACAVSREAIAGVFAAAGAWPSVDFHGLRPTEAWNAQKYWARTGEPISEALFRRGITAQEWAACGLFAVFAFEKL